MGQIKREARKYFDMNDNENLTYENINDSMKAMLRKCIAVKSHIQKEGDVLAIVNNAAMSMKMQVSP